MSAPCSDQELTTLLLDGCSLFFTGIAPCHLFLATRIAPFSGKMVRKGFEPLSPTPLLAFFRSFAPTFPQNLPLWYVHSHKSVFGSKLSYQSEWQDLNLHALDPKSRGLPITQHPDIWATMIKAAQFPMKRLITPGIKINLSLSDYDERFVLFRFFEDLHEFWVGTGTHRFPFDDHYFLASPATALLAPPAWSRHFFGSGCLPLALTLPMPSLGEPFRRHPLFSPGELPPWEPPVPTKGLEPITSSL